jgi:hypothetical protein
MKKENQMYRDSQHGLTIDLAGPDGNAFALMGFARQWAKQLGRDPDPIIEEMMSGDYNNLLDVFDKNFKYVATLLNDPRKGRGKDDDDS